MGSDDMSSSKSKWHLGWLVIIVVCTLVTLGVMVKEMSVETNSVNLLTGTGSGIGSARRLLQAKKKEKAPKLEITCEDPALQLVQEVFFADAFPNAQNVKRFEGSDLVEVNGNYYVVFDNIYNFGRLSKDLSNNFLLPHRAGVRGSSGYEALTYDSVTRQFYVIVETAPTPSPDAFTAIIEQIRVDEDTQTTQFVGRCASEYTFSHPNKGFEGAVTVRVDGTLFLIALCEGNFCEGTNRGKLLGNGKLVVMQRQNAIGNTPCVWRTVKQLDVPSVAQFEDYSALAIRETNTSGAFDIAITSQSNSQVWIGQITLGETVSEEWALSTGTVFNFPRTASKCGLQFCSIEGVGFLDDNKIVVVSDQGGGKGNDCKAHDEALQIFQLP